MRYQTGKQLRQAFLEYFAERGHTVVPSSALVPAQDPTLLFTNAGMVQFKDVFLGLERSPYNRAVTAQKCVRAGGKHNDLDTVGRTARHQTFFEMLGNFSFGDYFKGDAIAYAWEFLTGLLGLPPERLWVTVYRDDEEAARIWREETGLLPERIIRLGEKDNFWSMGDVGPCGPCSEIIYDRGEGYRCQAGVCGIGHCDCDRWLEIWNLVFMQFDRDSSGLLTALPRPSIDTGMGLERICSVLQGVDSNFETDLLRPLLRAVELLSGHSYDHGPAGFPFRVIADHARSCTFLVADGVLPGNEGRGYVLRRILRRAARFGQSLAIDGAFLYRLVPVVVEILGDTYPEIASNQEHIQRAIRAEEDKFQETLAAGLKLAASIVAGVRAAGGGSISGCEAFLLYDTYGFPPDLMEDIAGENGLTLDHEGFDQAMEEQRRRARAAREEDRVQDEGVAYVLEQVGQSGATSFVGYEELECTGQVIALAAGQGPLDTLLAGQQALIVLDITPFYGEGGGQAGDTGTLSSPQGEFRVTGTRRLPGGLLAHAGKLERGRLEVGDRVRALVDSDRRLAIARHHSATHLLHRALQETLGPGTRQAGSLVAPERLRFDFSYFRSLTPGELREVEDRVNRQVLADLPVEAFETSIAEAREMGAMALFTEKYGEEVRVVSMGDYSLELCGGTHVRGTAKIGLVRLVSEGGVGSGLRRIEAVAGMASLELWRQEQDVLAAAAALVKSSPLEVAERLRALQTEIKEKDRQLATLGKQLTRYQLAALLEEVETVGGVRVLAASVQAASAEGLREVGDRLRDRLGSGVLVLGSEFEERVGLVAMVTRDLVSRGLHAGNLVRQVAVACGGSGGGRPEMAQAGARDPARLKAALALVKDLVAGQMQGGGQAAALESRPEKAGGSSLSAKR